MSLAGFYIVGGVLKKKKAKKDLKAGSTENE
jgi:hypothetical protein